MVAETLQDISFARAQVKGVDLAGLVYRRDVPDWWTEHQNAVLAPEWQPMPAIIPPSNKNMPTNSLVVFRSGGTYALTISGEGSEILIGPDCVLEYAQIRCGGGKITIGRGFKCDADLQIDLRNGGSLHIGESCIAELRVEISTLDINPIFEIESRTRITKINKEIHIGSRVWLGTESVINGGATIGSDSVIRARSVVVDPLPSNALCEGNPAEAIQLGIVWQQENIE
ncbi:acetyltransferase-like isoleucine patch superfamily enzyme [Methylobacterium sp. OAE515]|uniref:acyltransferase n=1 Tax=Methylobacterium sp. OAE515 TaxID=2817895 RepID=UPI00178A7115